MDPQECEALHKCMAALKRRLPLAFVGLICVTASLVLSVPVQSVPARANFVLPPGSAVTRADLDKIQSQMIEFRGELAALETRITAIESELRALKSQPLVARYLLAAAAGAAVTYFFVTRVRH